MANLFIICGHGAGDPGACGNGYQEAERVRALADRIKYFGGDSVVVGDTSKNWYKSKLVNNTNIPKGAKVLELHMDSAARTARGGHVVIDADLTPDKYDNALADFISCVFPGRAYKLVKRNDLANLNRAQKAKINYRLMECGFITNAGDVKTFNSRMDEIAKGILKCFEIKVEDEGLQEQEAQTVHEGKILEWQKAAVADGFDFSKCGCDGKWGSECEMVAQKAIVKKRVVGYKYPNLTKIVQVAVGVVADGKCGKGTKTAIVAYQKKHGLQADGCVGLGTWKKILGV